MRIVADTSALLALCFGSLGVLLLAKSKGHIASIRPSIDSIRQAGIYLGDGLVAAALGLAGE